jgi:outer membrane phospholipase A
MLDLTGVDASKLLLQVEESTAKDNGSLIETANATPGSDMVDKPPVLALSVYEPVYFLFGHKGELNAKFQISFKYRLFDDTGAIAGRFPWLDDLYLGFSQTSLWDLGEQSSPFYDSSYRPRLFYLDDDFFSLFDGRLHIGLETGFGHESNGKSETESRSINILFAKPLLTWGDPEGRHLYVAPMIFKYVERSDNPDIADYRGHTELLVGYGSKGGINGWATMRKGKRSTYASMEFNLSYPLARLSSGELSGWLMFQYFNGYGESLLDYNNRLNSQFRLGLAIAL